jgi:c-di-GMP-related signal transduction protein
MNQFPPTSLSYRGTSFRANLRSRQFSFEPIVGPNKQIFGLQALCRTRWEEDVSSAGVNTSSRTMVDNWLLYGFDEINGPRPIFLTCSRNTLLSGFLSLLPQSTIFEIQESMEPASDVMAAWSSLKAAGYRFALDDFDSPEKMASFLHLVSFIKVDFQHERRRERASMFRRLRLTKASPIAGNIQCEDDFQHAREDGYVLFQGAYLGESICFAKETDLIDPLRCMDILENLQDKGTNPEDLAKLIALEPGIECRLMRRANWVSPDNMVISSVQQALDIVERTDMQKLVTLAMAVASPTSVKQASSSIWRNSSRSDATSFGPWNEAGARDPHWLAAGP